MQSNQPFEQQSLIIWKSSWEWKTTIWGEIAGCSGKNSRERKLNESQYS